MANLVDDVWVLPIILLVAFALFMAYRFFGKESYTEYTEYSDSIVGGKEMMVLFTQDPWFTEIKDGRKTVEARIGPADKFTDLVGKTVKVKMGKEKLKVKVNDIRHYDSLSEYVKKEGYKKVAPHTKSDADAIKKYLELKNKAGDVIYSEEAIKEKGGIIAIEFELQ